MAHGFELGIEHGFEHEFGPDFGPGFDLKGAPNGLIRWVEGGVTWRNSFATGIETVTRLL